MSSKEVTDIYSTEEPQSAFHARVAFCLDIHNEVCPISTLSPWAFFPPAPTPAVSLDIALELYHAYKSQAACISVCTALMGRALLSCVNSYGMCFCTHAVLCILVNSQQNRGLTVPVAASKSARTQNIG